MSTVTAEPLRTAAEPLPENIPSIQPGGGVCYSIELAWGRVRRWWLKTFRPGYVRRMVEVRQGDTAGCPCDVVDSRDLKFFRNQCTVSWPGNPFAWRNKIPFARWGLAELVVMSVPLAAITALTA